jgi:7-cyano-7-deazaguanine synthase
MRAVVLLSGGLDSATAAAMAKAEGWSIDALTVRYGQIHAIEIEAARRVAKAIGVERHVELDIDLTAFGGSALVGTGAIPKGRDLDSGGVPSTYVPARNTVFLSLALAFAETHGADRIVIGVNAVDYSGYPDCRPEFIDAFQRMARLATRAGVEGAPLRIHAPLMDLGKADIIRRGLDLGVDYADTVSCYQPTDDGAACGRCDSCRLRRDGFAAAGVPDPTRYAGPGR